MARGDSLYLAGIILVSQVIKESMGTSCPYQKSDRILVPDQAKYVFENGRSLRECLKTDTTHSH